jgi:uncharacterized protein (TIGR02466 family)
MNNSLVKKNYFSTPIYFYNKNEWVDYLNKISDPYIEKAKEKNNYRDSYIVHHSENLQKDKDYLEFTNFICKTSLDILNEQGYDLTNFNISANQIWVQEFAKNGGGNHSQHTHWNGHISGFYFLKCSENTSYPVFKDSRIKKEMVQLPQKNDSLLTDATDIIKFKMLPGNFIFFNSYLDHEFSVDEGKESFRFIHFNLQALPKY